MTTRHYYLQFVCPSCHNHDLIHIGTSVTGWKFLFMGMDRLKLDSMARWVEYIRTAADEGAVIVSKEPDGTFGWVSLAGLIQVARNHQDEPNDYVVESASDSYWHDEEGFNFHEVKA